MCNTAYHDEQKSEWSSFIMRGEVIVKASMSFVLISIPDGSSDLFDSSISLLDSPRLNGLISTRP